MTRNDYRILTNALLSAYPKNKHSFEKYQQWCDTVRALASALKDENPRFDEAKWKIALFFKENEEDGAFESGVAEASK